MIPLLQELPSAPGETSQAHWAPRLPTCRAPCQWHRDGHGHIAPCTHGHCRCSSGLELPALNHQLQPDHCHHSRSQHSGGHPHYWNLSPRIVPMTYAEHQSWLDECIPGDLGISGLNTVYTNRIKAPECRWFHYSSTTWSQDQATNYLALPHQWMRLSCHLQWWPPVAHVPSSSAPSPTCGSAREHSGSPSWHPSREFKPWIAPDLSLDPTTPSQEWANCWRFCP